MALETSGFQLSQFDRAPNIPGNIGVVDTKSIYDSVTSALKQHETFRTLQQVQGLNDASMAYQTAHAQGLLSNLPDTLAADRAKSQLFAAQTNAAMPDVGLAQEANRTGYEAQTVKNRILSDPAFVKESMANKIMSPAVRKLTQLQGLIDRGDLDEDQTLAVRRAMGQELTPSQKAKLDADANKVHTIYNNDGVPVQFTNSGAMRVAGGSWTLGSPPPTSTGAPLAGMAATTGTPLAGMAATDGTPPATGGAAPSQGGVPQLFNSSLWGSSNKQKLDQKAALAFGAAGPKLSAIDLVEGTEAKTALGKTLDKGIEKAQEAVQIQQDHLTAFQLEKLKDDEVQAAITRMKQLVTKSGIKVTGGGVLGPVVRAFKPEDLATFNSDMAKLTSHIQLSNMLQLKRASATGATGFGNQSDAEGRILKSDYGELDGNTLSPEAMLAGLTRAENGLKNRQAETLSTIKQRLAVENARGWRMGMGRYQNQDQVSTILGFTPPETPASATPQASAEQLSFPQRESMAPSGLTFRSPDAPENRFSVSADQPAPEALAPTGEFDYAPTEVPAVSVAAPASAQTTRSGLKVVSDSSAAAEPDLESDLELAPTPESDSGMSTGAALATAGGAAAAASKYAPAVVKAVSNPQAKALRAVAQLKSGLPGLAGPARGVARVGGPAAAAFGTGYLAGETINERGPAITDAFGFTNTKADYGGKSPKLSEILADWYMKSEADPARTLGDRWADAYRAIWAAKIDDKRRAGALADLRETRKSWASAGYKLNTPVEEFERQQSEASQR